MDFTAQAWLWLYLGAFLMLAELVSPGFVVFFFGLAAVTVAGIKALMPALSMTWQLALFSFFCIVYLVALRRCMKRLFKGEGDESGQMADAFKGRVGRVTVAIRAGLPGRVLVGDAEWTAVADGPLDPGTDVTVERQDNLTLVVRKIDAA